MPKTETLIAQDPDRRIDENEPERQPAAQRGVDRIRRPSVLLIVLGVAIIPVQPGRRLGRYTDEMEASSASPAQRHEVHDD